jgi:predicted O-methyltransferase YrrM
LYVELSLAANLVLLALLAAALWKIKVYDETRKGRGLLRAWPVRQVTLSAFDKCFETTALGPDRHTEIRFVANYRVPATVSDLETWVLCNLARDASRIFEFGTCTGKTTYLLAANAPPNARVSSLTLEPDRVAEYRAAPGDAEDARRSALSESAFASFFYRGTPEAARIEQLYGDSKQFDETGYLGACDLVFVDGSHARSYVESDGRKALRMVKPGGVVLWHDYHGPRRARGVFDTLNKLAQELPLVHLQGTSLVAYRKAS